MAPVGALVLQLGLASGVVKGAAPLEIVDVDLVVPALADAGHRRAPFPAHRVLAGDEARIVATIRVGALSLVRPRITFSTSAPVRGRRDEPRSNGVFVGPAGPRFFVGSAVFTAEGNYRLSVHVDHDGGPHEADGTFTIEVAPAERKAPVERPPAAAPTPTPAPAVVGGAPESRVFGPDAAMIQRLKIGIRQAATKSACAECPALLKRADALGAEKDPAAALAQYQALLAELSRIQSP